MTLGVTYTRCYLYKRLPIKDELPLQDVIYAKCYL